MNDAGFTDAQTPALPRQSSRLNVACARGRNHHVAAIPRSPPGVECIQPIAPQDVDVQSLNINPSARPSVVAHADRAFPFGDKAFDAVISFDTLEHVYGAGLCLEEMVRVLPPGGAIHLLVPFLFPIHGRYRDYHRHTAQYWDRRCGELGLEVFAEPLTCGAFSARRRCSRDLGAGAGSGDSRWK
jgi:SAM-dependent methyltransferase